MVQSQHNQQEIDRIRAALATVAELVLIDEVYTPIFVRLEKELAKAEGQGDTIKRARDIVRQMAID